MVINDKLYSSFTINSQVVLELIKSLAFQRLKGVSQFGLPDKYYHLDGYSRYEHSLGVYILLHKLGASEAEQVAGLLHDISHTAFSHLIDWVIGDSTKEDYQDNRHLSVLSDKQVADVLYKYGYSPEMVADYSKFGLLERDSPGLCADRIDYSLRESPLEIARQCLPCLRVFNGEIVFSTTKSALVFAENFLDRQLQHWAGYEAITRYVLFSDLLRTAMQDKVIALEDFFITDEFIVSKLLQADKAMYLNLLHLLEKKNLNFLKKSAVVTRKKFRYVNPKILKNGKLVKLSDISEVFSQKLAQARQSGAVGTHAGILEILSKRN